MKHSFVCKLRLWTKSLLDDGPLSLIKFVYRLGSYRGQVLCYFNPSFLLVVLLNGCCILPAYFVHNGWSSDFNSFY